MRAAIFVLFLLCGTDRAAAEETVSWESLWAARQIWPIEGSAAGVVAETSASSGDGARLWGAVGVGLDAATTSGGRFDSLSAWGRVRTGYEWTVSHYGLISPWLGGRFGQEWGPGSGLLFDGSIGLASELRLWGSQYVVAAVSWRSDGAWEWEVGLRDRTLWKLPERPRTVPLVRKVPVVATRSPPIPPALVRLTQTVPPGAFAPDGTAQGPLLFVGLRAQPTADVVAWKWRVIAPQNQIFFEAGGQGFPNPVQSWNGSSSTGELAQSATDYQLNFEVTDRWGRSYSTTAVITTDILVLPVEGRYLIRLPSINFDANSAGGKTMKLTLMEQNTQVLNRLAEILKRYPQYSITIVGHANLVRWADPAQARLENERESIPLSVQRAQSIKDALVGLGLAASRIKVEGAGGNRPLFSFGDAANNWKNRRVEILLDPTAR